jgi:energy-coupling factor transporter ATP-binding protein EcfA2
MKEKTAREILSLGPGEGSELELAPGGVVVITGPNGVGKSAFIEQVRGSGTASVERFFGGRQVAFGSGDTDQVGQGVSKLLASLPNNVSRFYHPWGEQHLKSIVRRVLDKQAQTAQDIVRLVKDGTPIQAAETAKPQPITQINSVFASGRLSVRLDMEDGKLVAKRDGETYGIERLSDGERAALLLVGAIVIQPKNGYILIDEPERHLNQSIAGPFIAAAVRTRPDLGFVLSTHDLSLIDWLRPDDIIHISECKMMSAGAENRRYCYSLLGAGDGLPEELRNAILGSRRAVLLVEGTVTSEDRSLYGHIYPGWNVVPREGWDTVVTDVTSLNNNAEYHWLQAAGLVDGDGRSPEEVAVLKSKSVYALPMPTIENIFLHRSVVAEMAEAAAKLQGAPSGEARMTDIENQVRPLIERHKEEIIARRVMWSANRQLASQKVSLEKAKAGQAEIPAIDLNAIRKSVSDEFVTAIQHASVFDVIEKLPIKNTKIPSAVSKNAGFDNFKAFARAVLTQIELGSEAGERILKTIRDVLPTLPNPSAGDAEIDQQASDSTQTSIPKGE